MITIPAFAAVPEFPKGQPRPAFQRALAAHAA